jgi:DNA repair protein RadC
MRGIGPVKAVRILAAFEMGRRVLGREMGEECSSPSSVWKFLLPDIAGLDHEVLILLVLNNKNQVLRKKTVSVGTVSESLVHPREIFREAIRESGSRIIIAHNHPAGDLTPSGDDLRTTRRIQAAGDLMGIPLMDHLILTETGYRSLREEGYLKGTGG